MLTRAPQALQSEIQNDAVKRRRFLFGYRWCDVLALHPRGLDGGGLVGGQTDEAWRHSLRSDRILVADSASFFCRSPANNFGTV